MSPEDMWAFRRWVACQVGRMDAVGDFARDFCCDEAECCRAVRKADDLGRHLRESHWASNEAIDAYDAALSEFAAIVGHWIVGLHGFPTSGKDAAGEWMGRQGWKRVAFGDGVRRGLLALNPLVDPWPMGDLFVAYGALVTLQAVVERLGWDGAKRLTDVRRLLQRYGTEAGREIHGENCWAKIAYKTIDQMEREAAREVGKTEPLKVVVTDVRFENEALVVRSRGGVIIKIERPGVGPVNEHVSEKSIQVDATVVNDGTIEELGKAVLREVTRCQLMSQAAIVDKVRP